MNKVEAKEKQHKSWTMVAPGWGKYDPLMRTWAAPVTERMIALAAIREGSRVLDIACGAGEPALTIAERVGPGGGAGISICRLSTPSGTVTKGLFAASVQTLITAFPPGLSAVLAQCMHLTGSGMNMRPQRIVTASNEFFISSMTSPSTQRNSMFERERACALERA